MRPQHSNFLIQQLTHSPPPPVDAILTSPHSCCAEKETEAQTENKLSWSHLANYTGSHSGHGDSRTFESSLAARFNYPDPEALCPVTGCNPDLPGRTKGSEWALAAAIGPHFLSPLPQGL